MESKKILIIARDFIPFSTTLGGVIRVIKLCEFLLARGFEIHIIAARGVELDYFGYAPLIKQINIKYVNDFLQARNNLKKKAAQNSKPVDNCIIGKKSSPAVLQRLLTLIDRTFIPDMGIILAIKYMIKASRIIRKHNISNVLVTSPPHSSQVIGYLLKKRLKENINLIVEYRDSWNTLGIYSKMNPLLDRISRFLERKVLRSADQFIYHSPPVIEKIKNEILDVTWKSTLIMNGYDPQMKVSMKSSRFINDCIKIGYFGAITDASTGFRNPERFFRVLSVVEIPIKVIFYGQIDISHYWQKELGNRIEIKGSLSHKEALEKMAEMDVLMLIHSQKEGADEVIPAKIFEYMLVQRPILAIGPVPMESARMVEEGKLGYTMDLYDDEDIKIKLQNIYEDWRNSNLPEYGEAACRKYSRHYQFQKLLPILV